MFVVITAGGYDVHNMLVAIKIGDTISGFSNWICQKNIPRHLATQFQLRYRIPAFV